MSFAVQTSFQPPDGFTHSFRAIRAGRKVMRRLAAVLGAGALALSMLIVTPTPARADDTLIRFLLGATALAIVVHSATSSRAQPAPGKAHPRNARVLPDHCRETLQVRRRHVDVYNAQCLAQARVRHLPLNCQETVRTNLGPRRIYRAQCLWDAGFRAEQVTHRPAHPKARGQRGDWRALPSQCQIIYIHHGQRHHGQDAACLHGHGWRNLPQTCLVRGSHQQIFSSACLRDHGYRTH